MPKHPSVDTLKERPVRSFVRRVGRVTAAQQEAYDKGWSQFGLQHADGELQVAADNVVLEIGFGMGDSLADMAAAAPASLFVGVEVHRPGIGRLLHYALERELQNLRVYEHDAVEILRDCIADNSLTRIQVFFPDPWHKTKHHKRRLIQPEFAALLAAKLVPGGHLHLATDWENYAEHILRVLNATPGISNCAGGAGFSPRPDYRPVTKFERRGQRLGHGVWDLIYRRD